MDLTVRYKANKHEMTWLETNSSVSGNG